MKTILIVEDEDPIRKALVRLLLKYFDVIAVDSLAEARRHIEDPTTKIEVVLSDINLRDGTSSQLHTSLTKYLSKRQIGWVSMTGYAKQSDLDYFGGHGIQILKKTCSVHDLVAAIELASYKARPNQV